jgi:hypothetical protein
LKVSLGLKAVRDNGRLSIQTSKVSIISYKTNLQAQFLLLTKLYSASVMENVTVFSMLQFKPCFNPVHSICEITNSDFIPCIQYVITCVCFTTSHVLYNPITLYGTVVSVCTIYISIKTLHVTHHIESIYKRIIHIINVQ